MNKSYLKIGVTKIDLDNIAKVGEYYKLTIYIIYIKRSNRNVISYFKLKCGS